eukprot:2832953-Alexandrium_andersonii.AAC.1
MGRGGMIEGAGGSVHADELRDHDLLQVDARRGLPGGVRAFRFANVAPIQQRDHPGGDRRDYGGTDRDGTCDEQDWCDWYRDEEARAGGPLAALAPDSQ